MSGITSWCLLMNNRIKERVIEFAYATEGARNHRCHHVAAIFKKNFILSLGINSAKTHPQIKKHDYPSNARLHSELAAAIKGGLEDYSEYSMFVLRINRNKNLDFSRPCKHCRSMLEQLNFKRVYFTDRLGKILELN